jgi:hypothetical protein
MSIVSHDLWLKFNTEWSKHEKQVEVLEALKPVEGRRGPIEAPIEVIEVKHLHRGSSVDRYFRVRSDLAEGVCDTRTMLFDDRDWE